MQHNIETGSILRQLVIVTIVLAGLTWRGNAQDFPLRSKFPALQPISTKELVAEYGKILIVDVRSDVEFEVIHIKDALHIPWGTVVFGNLLESAVKGKRDARIAFYCNGQSCAKSYHAAEEAVKLGYSAVFVYDAGILEWTKTYPEKAVLMGKTPADKSQIVSDSEFKQHLLDKDAFTKQASQANALVIDVRDPAQRKKNPDFGKPAMLSPLDKLVKTLGEKSFKQNAQGKTIYLFDAVGKQVEWLQYHLKKEGYTTYFFLKDGVRAIVGEEN